MEKYYRIIIALVMMTFAFLFIDDSVSAAEISQEESGSIYIYYAYNSDPLDDVTFKVYKIASVEGAFDFTTSEKFQEIEIDYDFIEEAEYLQLLRGNLENYINLFAVEPDMVCVTDSLGDYYLEELDLGLYIIMADNMETSTDRLLAEPILVMVGSYDGEKWLYHFDISAKLGVLSEFDDPDITVSKQWENVNSALLKPEEIEVGLYCNGELYESVILNDENGWSYTWEDVNFFDTWAVSELTYLEDYDVSYSKEGFVFTITNTYAGVLSEELPQTSSLALYVVLFAGVGILCILAGVLLKPRDKEVEIL